MPKITLSLPHQLPRPEVKKRVEELIVQLQSEAGGMLSHVDKQWQGDTLTFTMSGMGMKVKGEVVVEDTQARLDVDLPLPLAMMAGNVKQTIETEGRKLLSKPAS